MKKGHHGESKLLPISQSLSLPQNCSSLQASGLLRLFKMAGLLFTSLFVCLSKMENSKEGVLLFP